MPAFPRKKDPTAFSSTRLYFGRNQCREEIRTMKLRILMGLILTAASFCPRSEAQTSGLTPGTVISWGGQVIPYVQPGTRYLAIAAGGVHSLALKSDGTVVAWGDKVQGQSTVPAKLTGGVPIAAGEGKRLGLYVGR